jgi:hypothetical protein
MDIPDLDPAKFCPPSATRITSALWKPHVMTLSGTYCVTGNVETQGDAGSMNSMRSVSIIASGSIKVSGKPFFRAAHPDGFVLLAGGDLDLQVSAGLEGIVYCGGQTYVSDKAIIVGQLICKNKSPHPGENWSDKNLISGEATIRYNCSANSSYRVVAWYPTLGG